MRPFTAAIVTFVVLLFGLPILLGDRLVGVVGTAAIMLAILVLVPGAVYVVMTVRRTAQT